MSKNVDPWKNLVYSIDEMEAMEEDAGDSLEIGGLIGEDCFIAENGKKFRGSSLMINLSVLQDILDGEDDALSALPNVRKPSDMFRHKRSSRSVNNSIIIDEGDEDEE